MNVLTSKKKPQDALIDKEEHYEDDPIMEEPVYWVEQNILQAFSWRKDKPSL